jgi:hypothetical protein
MIEKQKINNKESITLWKPGGGSRNARENRKPTTKSRSPLQARRGIKEPMGKRKVNNKQSLNKTVPQHNIFVHSLLLI